MRFLMGWENHLENMLRHPGGSGKAGEKLKEQPSRAHQTAIILPENETFPLWLLSDLQLSNSSWGNAPIDGEGLSGQRSVLQAHVYWFTLLFIIFPRLLISRFKWEEGWAHLAGNNSQRSKASGGSGGKGLLPGLTRAYDLGLELGS